MSQKTYTTVIEDKYTFLNETFDTNEDYINFVLNKAAESYQKQYNTNTVEDGITAAREAYNNALPVA